MSEPDPRRVVTPECRLSYPHVFKPHAMDDKQDPKFSVEMLFDGDTDLSAMRAAAKAAIAEKFPKLKAGQAEAMLAKRFRDGSERDNEEYEGCVFVTAKTNADRPPGVVKGPAREPVVDPADVYGGVYARCSVTAFAYDHATGGKGVSFALNHVWIIRDGEPFGGFRSAEDDFGSVDVDADAFGGDVPDEVASKF